jgi:hypothetical protein
MAEISRVRIEDKYNVDLGFQYLDTSLFPDLQSTLNQFVVGELRSFRVAQSIIEALFSRDFDPNPKWDVDCSSCIEIGSKNNTEDEFPVSFSCKQEATWNHKDIYAVAKSSAKITFLSRSEIDVENYSYYVSG